MGERLWLLVWRLIPDWLWGVYVRRVRLAGVQCRLFGGHNWRRYENGGFCQCCLRWSDEETSDA